RPRPQHPQMKPRARTFRSVSWCPRAAGRGRPALRPKSACHAFVSASQFPHESPGTAPQSRLARVGRPMVTTKKPVFGMISVATPLLGCLVGGLYAGRRHGYESGEASLLHLFEFAGIFWLGFAIAAILLTIGFVRRERFCWLALLAIILD